MLTPPEEWVEKWSEVLQRSSVDQLIRTSLEEDIGSGDITTESVFQGPQPGRGVIVARKPTVVCGLPLAEEVFRRIADSTEFTFEVREGRRVAPGTAIASVKGDIRGLLTAERCVLNFLMRLCGVADYARQAVEQIPPSSSARVFDTRKTTPGWRDLEKLAVKIGGAHNHRHGLFDAALIKDNHIAAAGSIVDAIRKVRHQVPSGTVVQVEVDTLEQLDQALAAGPDIVLLDNFEPSRLKEAVRRTGGRVELEASGGIRLENLSEIANTGVDRISMGALTHSAPPADLSLEILSSS